jgi:hypothetical protein
VQQAKKENHLGKVRRGHIEIFLKSTVVVKALVNDTDGNDCVNKPVVPSDLEERCKDQRNTVANRNDRSKTLSTTPTCGKPSNEVLKGGVEVAALSFCTLHQHGVKHEYFNQS